MSKSRYNASHEEALTAAAPITFADAEAFAEDWGFPVKSIVSKVRNMGLEYVRKPKTNKSGGVIVRKDDIVANIAALVEVPANAVEGLENAPKRALLALEARIFDMVSSTDEDVEDVDFEDI